MGRLLSFILFVIIHYLSRIFFRIQVGWIGPKRGFDSEIRLIVLLHHTSLFEPIFIGTMPLGFFWWGVGRLVIPGADKTLDRPIVGKFFKTLFPRAIPITRKRDKSWSAFLSCIQEDSLILIAPEGRMMRATGLDKGGKPMSVRGGVAEILANLHDGDILFLYSGGLHHVQIPGEKKVHLFQDVKVNYERVGIREYKESMGASDPKGFTAAVIADMNRRMSDHCPVPKDSKLKVANC